MDRIDVVLVLMTDLRRLEQEIGAGNKRQQYGEDGTDLFVLPPEQFVVIGVFTDAHGGETGGETGGWSFDNGQSSLAASFNFGDLRRYLGVFGRQFCQTGGEIAFFGYL